MEQPDPAIFEQKSAAAKADAAAMEQDAELAAAAADTPENRSARERVARLYCKIHLPAWTPQAVESYLATVEWAQPVQVINIAGVSETDLAPKAGFLGFRARRFQYLRGERLKAEKPEDPVFALKSTTARNGRPE